VDWPVSLGCDIAQAYHMARSLPTAAFDVWLRTAPWGSPEVELVRQA